MKHQDEKKHTQMEFKLPSGNLETTKQSTINDRLATADKTIQEQNNTKQSPNASLRSRINSIDSKVFKVIHNLYNKAKSCVKIMEKS